MERISHEGRLFKLVGQRLDSFDEGINVEIQLMHFKLVVFIPYFFEQILDCEHVSGDFFLPKNLVILIEADNSTKVDVYFLPLVCQPCRQLSQSPRSEYFTFLQKDGYFLLLTPLTPIVDIIHQAQPDIFPLLPYSHRRIIYKLLPLLPDFLLAIDDKLPHIFQEIVSSDCNGLMVIAVGNNLEPGGLVIEVVPHFDLFGHRPAGHSYTFVVDQILTVGNRVFHINFFCDFEEVIVRDVAIFLEMFEGIFLLRGSQIACAVFDKPGLFTGESQ